MGGDGLFSFLDVSLGQTTLMSKTVYKTLARVNKAVLPSYTKRRLDLAKASKWQLAIIGWRYFILKKALD